MKAVLISIRPKWCELIANGKKTIVVRRTKPKIKTPFKCYIYCTKEIRAHALHLYINGGIGRQKFGIAEYWRSGKEIVDVNPHLPAYRFNSYLAEGKVIGEFVCNGIIADKTLGRDEMFNACACMNETDAVAYCKGKEVYGWHISDLVIYDKPKEVGEFHHCGENYHFDPVVIKPPQSWCYVEDMQK